VLNWTKISNANVRVDEYVDFPDNFESAVRINNRYLHRRSYPPSFSADRFLNLRLELTKKTQNMSISLVKVSMTVSEMNEVQIFFK